MSQLGGLARAQPWVLVLYLVGAASISGVPLFSGFPAKELVVASVGDGGYGTAQWLLKFASVGTFLSVALKLPAWTWFGDPKGAATVATLRRVPTTMYVAMGAAAAANIAIGLRPALLYDLMPSEVVFQPYTTAKVFETLVLLLGTSVGFVLLRHRLTPAGKVSVDTDWVYRELPWRVAAVVASRRPAAIGEAPRPGGGFRLVPAGLFASTASRTKASIAPGWILGSAVVATMVLVLAASVLP
jgi:multicomponent Na+:H+ antiporter subunit D